MSYRLAIFDLDGTILDSMEDLKESTNAALAANGYPARTLDEVRCFVGNGIGKLIERAVPKGTSKEATEKTLESFKVHYGIHCADHTKPYDGILKLLEDLRKCGIQTAVSTFRKHLILSLASEKASEENLVRTAFLKF